MVPAGKSRLSEQTCRNSSPSTAANKEQGDGKHSHIRQVGGVEKRGIYPDYSPDKRGTHVVYSQEKRALTTDYSPLVKRAGAVGADYGFEKRDATFAYRRSGEN